MSEFIIRKAVLNDIPFLAETIIEAEKGGTDKLSYSTVFGLSIEEVRHYLTLMLNEEIDGCELSVSSFLVAETNGNVVAAVSAWIEGSEGIPSSVLKGNLLSYTLPEKCIERASSLGYLINDIHIDFAPDTIQLGLGYVLNSFRGNDLSTRLVNKQFENLSQLRPDISEIFTQIFECNRPSLRSAEKLGFKPVLIKESLKEEILNYLPFNKKILLKKTIIK
jgi:hypothetical protein